MHPRLASVSRLWSAALQHYTAAVAANTLGSAWVAVGVIALRKQHQMVAGVGKFWLLPVGAVPFSYQRTCRSLSLCAALVAGEAAAQSAFCDLGERAGLVRDFVQKYPLDAVTLAILGQLGSELDQGSTWQCVTT